MSGRGAPRGGGGGWQPRGGGRGGGAFPVFQAKKWVKPGSAAALAATAAAALVDASPPAYPGPEATSAADVPAWAGAGEGDPVPAPSRKWLKPGSEAALAAAARADAARADAAMADAAMADAAPPPAYPGAEAAPEAEGFAWADGGGEDSVPAPNRKWVKGEGVIPSGGRSPVLGLGGAGGSSPVPQAPAAPVDPAFERGKVAPHTAGCEAVS